MIDMIKAGRLLWLVSCNAILIFVPAGAGRNSLECAEYAFVSPKGDS